MHLFHTIKSLDLNEKQIEGIKSDIRNPKFSDQPR